ncbi:HWE histidine kinase domain-containing protein [Alteromonas sp. ASW11-130]|uniref:HWE histidine kinase domain-containing protein n=1 Tax=Alteromonas sp. ASW11-130 TaxID=3015775 RepID=UPI002241B339|nr:HWE histidine kinase domain-containing protein [Alteromonas sp. ASW11-130]MCW8090608.1 GAF domain-containing protein [Alteromonas sp. ASW11-130]
MTSPELPAYPEKVDLSNCDREPIHLIGNIQSHGCLVALRSDWIVAYCSQNTLEYFGASPDSLIGEPIKNWLDKDTLHHIRSGLQSSMITGRNERLFNQFIEITKAEVDVSIHHNGQLIIIEFELVNEEREPASEFVRSLLSQFYRVADTNALFETVAEQLRLITSFDRVMIYKFLPDGSGEVISEAKSHKLEAFLGLRFPASDIPKQARALYLKNLLRVIGNVNSDVYPILPACGPGGETIDLSFSTLRAVSPIHIEYLQNMGVVASLSVSIVVNGKLWGLIACHHYSPKVPSYFERTELELFAEVFALELSSRLAKDSESESLRVRKVHNKIMSTISSDGALIDIITKQFRTLNELIENDGISVIVEGQVSCTGRALPEGELRKVIRYLIGQPPSQIIAINSLVAVIPNYKSSVHKIAGLLAIPVSRAPRDYLLFLREAQTNTINWAGNPQKAVAIGPNGARLLPRGSFELWQETHENCCHEWTENDEIVGESLRITLLEVMLRHVQERDTILQQAGRKHEILISELNHRVRNILNLVNAIILQTDHSERSTEDFVNVLTGRLSALASAHNQLTASEWTEISLDELLETEIQEYMNADTRIKRNGPKIKLHPEAATPVVLIMHELFTNAAKYGALSRSRHGRVEIEWYITQDNDLAIEWQEVGGPPVAPPTQEGFGMTLIQSVIPHELQGKADVEFSPQGLKARFTFPKRFITEVEASRRSSPLMDHATELQASVLPDNALVVEDSLVIAMEIQKKLKSMGIKHVSVVGNIKNATKRYQEEKFGFVVFDIHLGKETTLGLIKRVAADNIPCVIMSGYGDQLQLPKECDSVPILTKPVSENELKLILHSLFQENN